MKIVYLVVKRGQNILFFLLNLNMGFYYFFIMAFLIKLPVFSFHLWLPKAHVESSTVGSMVLAGVLLKLGRYGLLLFRSYIRVRV